MVVEYDPILMLAYNCSQDYIHNSGCQTVSFKLSCKILGTWLNFW